MTRDEAEKIIGAALDMSRADQTEAVLIGTDSALTRYAGGGIHQNLAECQESLHVRAVVGGRIGCASTNNLAPGAVREVVEKACDMARQSPPKNGFQSLPGPAPVPDPSIRRGGLRASAPAWSEATAGFSADQRAQVVAEIGERAREAGLEASGAVRRDCSALAVGNSLGVFAFSRTSEAAVTVLAAGPTSTGWARFEGHDIRRLDVPALAGRAIDTALRSAEPRTLESGEYPVILEPEAVAEMLHMLAYCGFSAQAFLEGRSFMSQQIGSRVAAESVTIADDAFNPQNPGMGFDFEGVPKKRVEMISRGVACSVVWDSYTASLAGSGQQSTGHGLLAPNPFGPYPDDMVMECGECSLEQMVEAAHGAILVTRLHYTNLAHDLKTIITGMTRDGTFWIEKGQVAYGVKNLRFTQSILEALARVEAISTERQVAEGSLVPALYVSRFRFTGATEF